MMGFVLIIAAPAHEVYNKLSKTPEIIEVPSSLWRIRSYC